MAFDIGSMLQQYLGGGQSASAGQVEQHFDEVAQNAPQEDVGGGIAEALRSDQTPPFGQMVGQLFGNGDAQQRAGMLNQLVTSLGPGVLGALGGALGGGGLGGLAGMLGGGHGAANTITPEQASQIDPAQVQQIAERAEAHDPSIIDRMGNFYAAHPTLVKTLGSAALAIAMSKMAQQRNA
jgi:hypothetical protein